MPADTPSDKPDTRTFADTPRTARQEAEDTLRDVQATQELMEQALHIQAAVLHARYKSLQAAGFNPEQAFSIILSRGLD